MIRGFYLALCLMIVGLCGCGSKSGLSSAKSGMTAFKEGQYEKAIADLTYATSRITNSPELYYNLGVAHLELGQIPQAQAAFSEALKLNPAYSDALACLGQIELQQNNLPAASDLLEKALSTSASPDAKARILTTMGLVEAGRKRYDLSRLYYLRAIKENRKHEPAYYNLATLYRDDYKFIEEALDNFELFVRITNPKNRYYEKAVNNIKPLRNNLERISANEPEVVRRDSPKAAKLLQDGVTAYSVKQYSKAIRCYQEAMDADPLTFSAAYGLGKVYQQQGLWREARNAFKRATEINPNHQECYCAAAELSLQLRETGAAGKLLDKAIARSPFNPASAKLMARLRYSEGRYPEARLYGEFYLSLIPPTEPGRAAYEKWVASLPKK
jgi:tetratricopeptide (TPR) repeat protein